jgi:hypothetical protein
MTSASSSKKNGLVIADSGAIFSLAVLDQLELLNALFDDAAIPRAVWEEITLNRTVSFYWRMRSFFKERVRPLQGMNAGAAFLSIQVTGEQGNIRQLSDCYAIVLMDRNWLITAIIFPWSWFLRWIMKYSIQFVTHTFRCWQLRFLSGLPVEQLKNQERGDF